jgi:rubrerythrin
MNKVFNPQELLAIAVRIEENGYAYYSRVAAAAQSPTAKKMFEILAKAEQKHIQDFQSIQKTLSSASFEIPEEYQSPEISTYLSSLSDGEIFSNLMPPEKVMESIKNDKDAIRHAITFEKDSIMFFHEIYDLLPVDVPDRKAVGELIKQEKMHMARLYVALNDSEK